MGNNVDEITVGANGKLWLAPVGSTIPATAVATPDAAFVDVGFTSEDGATLTDSKTVEAIPVWQLFGPARRIITERDLSIAVTMRQWNADTVKVAFGGGEVTAISGHAGHFKYTPPAPEDIDERCALLDWVDGAKHYRLVVPRCMSVENVESNLARAKAADLPITLGVLFDDGADPWYLLTDDPAFAPPED